MVFKWKIEGFENYIVSEHGHVLRIEYCTRHMHYKSPRFITFNKRNQIRLYKNGSLEYWSKKQLRNKLYKIDSIKVEMKAQITTPF